MIAELWLVAGVNGAGKTTLTTREDLRLVLGYLELLNPDALVPGLIAAHPAWSLGEANLVAVQQVEAELARRIEARESVLVETVLSSNKYLHHVERAREQGFLIGMIYVALPDVETSIARVAERVERGGHDVPEIKLRERWTRSLDNLAVFAKLVDRLFVFSNAKEDGPPLLVARKAQGRLRIENADSLPEVTARLRKLE